jgi:hypothetical protein
MKMSEELISVGDEGVGLMKFSLMAEHGMYNVYSLLIAIIFDSP